ncbi:YfhO family protein [Kribbella sp. NPDC000426]|uniref:YfhO family protein n=1 Tax=Kribbella sp. NPDC000426 TaxID=3154255 RepID=UPI003319ED19
MNRGFAARAGRQWPAPAAGVAAGLTFVISGIIRGTYPFGDRPRSTNDLGQQFVPMYAHYRDMLTGRGVGDLLFNWSSGFGVPFLGDFMAYVGSPLSWIVVLFPRDHIDLALFLVDVLAIGLAAGAMTTYLRRLRPGPVWIAVVAGISYGACGWAIDDAAYMSVWLNGLVAFPVLCLLCEWILSRRSAVSLLVTPFVVALLWTSHFYTVYMATIGAAIVVVARILAYDATVSWRTRLTGGLRCVVAIGIGIGLAAPFLLPTFRIVQAARPSPDVTFKPISAIDFLARLLPGSEGVGATPGLAVGTVLLLLAVSFPFNRAVPGRERIVWSAAVVLTVFSMQVDFTHDVWHGFDTPNGSQYRQAFIVCGLLVILGWLSAAAGLRTMLAVAAPVCIVLILYLVMWNVRTTTTTTRIVVPLLIVIAAGTWFARRRPDRLRRVAVALLVGAVIAEVSVSSAAIDAQRSKILSAKAPWGEQHTAIRGLVESAADWPTHRAAPGADQTVNDPMLIGGQGPQYYSSTIPDRVSQQLLDLGFGYSSYGRATIDPQNPVVDAAFAIRSRVVVGDDDDVPKLETYDAAPLVTVRPVKPFSSRDPGPFGVQETALGADVYTIPKVLGEKDPDVTVSDRRGGLTITPTPGAALPVETRLHATCVPGSEIWFAAPTYVGDVFVDGRGWVTNLDPKAKSPGIYSGAPMLRVGTVGTEGKVDVTLRLAARTKLPLSPIGCLHRDRLDAAVAQLSASKASEVSVGGHSIHVRLQPGDAATVVIAVIRIDGWRCSVDGKPGRNPSTRGGLVAVAAPAGTSEVSCSYRPVGARTGLAIGAIALLGLLAVAGVLLVVRRRPRRPSPRL